MQVEMVGASATLGDGGGEGHGEGGGDGGGRRLLVPGGIEVLGDAARRWRPPQRHEGCIVKGDANYRGDVGGEGGGDLDASFHDIAGYLRGASP